ncbi:SLC13 family permease [Nesterenkonia sp. CF4.4]|uniref:SLC13 family permease n=1 Tax=Nesterenkonia sp. CF4.4 TaxID=3373079 RepID=UPI003EE660E0
MSAYSAQRVWDELWESHRQIKRLVMFSVGRGSYRPEPARAQSGGRSSASVYRPDQARNEDEETRNGPPGGYTPARLLGLALGPLLFLVTLLFFESEGLSSEGVAVLAATLWIATWWITEVVPIPVTSLLPVVLLPLTGALEGDAVVSSYGNDIIFLFLGGFSLAIAMEKWNLHKRIALTIVAMIGTSPRRIILGFMIATAFLSMWVSNTAATMMMIPVGLAVAYQAARTLEKGEHLDEIPKFEKCIVFCIGYAATIGGLGTLIGTPPLAVLAAVTGEVFGQTISFGQWMLFGVPIVILLLAFAWFYLTFVKFRFGFSQLPGGREVIRDEKALLGRLSTEEKAVLAIFIGTAFMWISRGFIWDDLLPGISDGMIAVTAAVLLFMVPTRSGNASRILEWEDSKKIPWGILLLFGGGLAIAAGFVETGLSDWIGDQLLVLEGVNIVLTVLVATALVLFLTEITSNAATATMILPVMAAFGLALGVHPYALMVPTAMAANCAFMLPVGTPPNAVMFGTGKITIMDMVRIGFWLNLAALFLIVAATFLVLPHIWGIDLFSVPADFQ